jgi:23S rRNA U2552 (ribose-2'-O)-methylase RlmE/FtsJ
MELLEKCIFKLYNHTDKPQWNLENQPSDIFFEVESLLKKNKQRLDQIPKNVWNNFKKLINDFESLNIINKHNHNIGIADYIPISRAFFKMWEISNDFNLLDSSNNIVYGALCEGPGGFIEAFNLYRKQRHNNIKDTIVAMTLKNDTDVLVPAWKKSHKVLKECNHIYITYGADNTGSIYNIHNIQNYVKMLEEYKADLVTADGGFDFSPDYNNQETTISHLLYCEAITGILSLKKGGNMVLKMFDCFEKITVDLLYVLAYYFKEVNIVKPLTSRPLNSEKYIVCKGYLNNCDEHDKISMLHIAENMNNMNYVSLIKNEIPLKFIECINAINTAFAFRQIRYINKIFLIYDQKIHRMPILYKEKIVYCIAWCKKYGFPININTPLLT